MQLILTTDVDTGIPSKMSTVEQKSLDHKFDHAALIENLIKDYEGHNGDENTEKVEDTSIETQNNGTEDETVKELQSDEDVSMGDKSKANTEENGNKIEDEIEQEDLDTTENGETESNNIESGVEIEEEKDCNDGTGNSDVQHEESEKSNDEILAGNEKQGDTADIVQSEENIDAVELNDNEQEAMDVDSTYVDQDGENEQSEVINTGDISNAVPSHVNTGNEEVINISDDKDEDVGHKIDKQDELQDDKTTHEETSNVSDVLNESNNESHDKVINNTTTREQQSKNLNTSDSSLSVSLNKKAPTENISEEKKKLSHICKLSNTLDILSDEEEEITQKDNEKTPQKENISDNDKCINIDDDDDIMLVDEENTTLVTKDAVDEEKHDKTEDSSKTENVNENCIEEPKSNISQEIQTSTQEETSKNTENIINSETKEIEEKSTASCNKTKPLLPTNFLKTCKKNLSDMTRDELEQFCIMKIVEGVVDRSNLAEIKNQVKIMAQNLDEYKKRTLMISKQNRDLQVVLKSVQEEQKKRPDHVINPLKITRSVGMQVLMTDKSSVRRKANNNSPNKQTKSQLVNTKKTQIIPVPRLVPAVSSSNASNKSTPSKPPPIALVNGMSLKTSPSALKSEKRTHSKMQQNNPDTVDLTDDEPPSKQPQRNINPPVRLVPPQNLMATPRQTFATNMNSPRKVYIPISGSQNQSVRPGQTFMLKAISTAQGPRQRMAPSLMSKQPANVRVNRQLTRHPAPLPESSRQFEPPNWKSLPPAPELKLSKVENGIVISWKIDGFIEENYEEIASFQLYAYQETTSPPNTALWKKIGDVKALPLPMACTLTQFMAGYQYYFAVRAVDVKSRVGPFSEPGSILLLNKM